MSSKIIEESTLEHTNVVVAKQPTPPGVCANKTAQCLLLDQLGSAPLIMSYASLSVAILVLAEESVGCEDLDDDEECNEKIWGVKPSSIITLFNGVSGLISAFLMPLSGAIVDYSPYRRAVGYWTAMSIVLINGIQICIGSETWQLCVTGVLFAPPLFFLHTVIMNAYIAGLSDNPDEIAMYVSKFDVARYIANFSFVGLIFGLSKAFNTGDVDTAILAQVICVAFSFPIFHFAWKRFPEVPPIQIRTENVSYLTAGCKNLYKTKKEIADKNPPLKWFFRTIWFTSPGGTSFFLTLPTFCKTWLDFSTDEAVLVTFAVSLAAAPGALMGKVLCKITNPLTSMRIYCVYLFLTSFICAALLKGPESHNLSYVWISFVGVGIGGYFVSETTLVATVIPEDQQAELMGLYVFMSRVFVWICPVILLIVNERGIDLNRGMVLVQLPSLIGFFISFGMGNYDNVIEHSVHHKSHRESIRESIRETNMVNRNNLSVEEVK